MGAGMNVLQNIIFLPLYIIYIAHLRRLKAVDFCLRSL